MIATVTCHRCGFENELNACNNCGGTSFRRGDFSDGSFGMICDACNLGYAYIPCQGGCGAQIPTAEFGTPISRVARGISSGIAAHQGTGGCFVATELYGIDSREVAVLRGFRDRVLLPNRLGTRFVDFYYRAAPVILLRMRRSKIVRASVRAFVAACVFLLGRPMRH